MRSILERTAYSVQGLVTEAKLYAKRYPLNAEATGRSV